MGTLAHRLHIMFSDFQYRLLDEEADRSSVSIAELVRRAVDNTYAPEPPRKVLSIVHTLGRRPGRRLG
jgi:hypothetical protein